jgi:hypothetical protein
MNAPTNIRSAPAVASDKPPLLGKVQFGRIVPMNGPARLAMKAAEGLEVRFEIKRSGANQRRRGFYWVMLDVASEALTDRAGVPMDAELLHDVLKRKLKLGEEFVLPSGEVVFKPRSTSNRAMTEPERARWTDRCVNVLSHWLGVEVTELMNEVRSRNGGDPEQRKAA